MTHADGQKPNPWINQIRFVTRRTYIEFGLKHPDHCKLTFMVRHERDELKRCHEFSMAHRAFEILRFCVQECIASGVSRRIDLSLTSHALWAGMHGITSLLIARPDFPWTQKDRTTELLLDSLCEGFQKINQTAR